jgi:hypothetical protein
LSAEIPFFIAVANYKITDFESNIDIRELRILAVIKATVK